MYKYEMHAHCKEVSACGVSSAEEMVLAHYNNGYSGMVFTDHFIHGNTNIPRCGDWKDRMKFWYNSYAKAKLLAEDLNFCLMLGLEHYYASGKEFLIYGEITYDALAEYSYLATADVKEFVRFCHKNNWFVAQAHPFRQRDYIDPAVLPDPAVLDGVEVYNHCNNESENLKAEEFCKKYNLIPISGSDTHIVSLCGNAGVAFKDKIVNSRDLAEKLFAGKAYLIKNKIIQPEDR